MESFEDLGLAPELVEALAAEGIEVPTAFQAQAIPVLLRGNNLVGLAGPGAGTLAAYGVALLERVDPEAPGPRALVVVPTVGRADALAESLGRLARFTGHRIAALGSPWALPELAAILVGTAADLVAGLRGSRLSLEGVETLVIDGFQALTEAGEADALAALMDAVPKDAQRVLLSLPLTPEAEAFAEAHLRRAVHVPPRAASGGAAAPSPARGEILYRVVSEDGEETLLASVARLLEESRHVLVFFRTEDRAADAGDFLSLHGYAAGAPGDDAVPVWLGVDEIACRRLLQDADDAEGVATLSAEVPPDVDSLDRRHGAGGPATILVLPRELPHLRETARQAGYTLRPAPEPPPTRITGEHQRMAARIERVLESRVLAPHYFALEPLFRRYAPAEVAAAALALLLEESRKPPGGPRDDEVPEEQGAATPPPPTWVRLFVGVGSRDGVGPGDLLGAIVGEAGLESARVGKIEIRDTFSLVEVAPRVADRVIRALNGTTIRGRSVRADYDRAPQRGRGEGGRSRRGRR